MEAETKSEMFIVQRFLRQVKMVHVKRRAFEPDISPLDCPSAHTENHMISGSKYSSKTALGNPLFFSYL